MPRNMAYFGPWLKSTAWFYGTCYGPKAFSAGSLPFKTRSLLEEMSASIIPPHQGQREASGISLLPWSSQVKNPCNEAHERQPKELLSSPVRCRFHLTSPPTSWTLNKRRPAPQNTPKFPCVLLADAQPLCMAVHLLAIPFLLSR